MSIRLEASPGTLKFDKAAVERAAKVICETVCAHTWKGADKAVKDSYREDARAVIAALNGASA